MGAVASNDVDLSDLLSYKGVENLVDAADQATPRGAQDRTAFLVDILYQVGRERDPSILGVETFVSPLNAEDFLNLVIVMQCHEQFANHDVQTRTETSTRHDANLRFGRLVEDVGPRASLDELDALCDVPVRVVALVCGHEIIMLLESFTGQETAATVHILFEIVSDKGRHDHMGVEVLSSFENVLGVHRGQVIDVVHARHLVLGQMMTQLHQRRGAPQVQRFPFRLLLSCRYSLLLDLISFESFFNWLWDSLCLCSAF